MGHAKIRTKTLGKYERGTRLPIVYDPSDVATPYSPAGPVDTVDTVGQIVFGAFIGLVALAAAWIYAPPLRRTRRQSDSG